MRPVVLRWYSKIQGMQFPLKMPREHMRNFRSQGFPRIFKKQAIKFCLETGLHGYKYMVHHQRSKIERIVWGVTVFSALSCAAVLMHTAWEYNSSRATLTVIESTHRGIWNYPFPAVTICNLNRVSHSRAKQLVDRLNLPRNITPDYVVNQMKLLLELLNPGVLGDEIKSNLSRLQSIFEDNDITIQEVVNLVTQNCSSLILSCKWKGSSTPCIELFEETYSREGLCCSFNHIRSTEEMATKRSQRVTACGYQTGLTVILNPEQEDYFAPLLGSYGVKIVLHFPYDYPDRSAENKLIGPGYQVFLSITPEETYSSPDIRKLGISSRNCIFTDEAPRIYAANRHTSNLTSATYSYVNCLAECRASVIKAKCQCIPYYYPQNKTRVCNLRDVQCLKNYSEWHDTSFPGVPLSSHTIFKSRQTNDFDRPCNCQPDCTLYRYPVEGSQGVLDKLNSFNQNNFFENMNIKTQSMVHIFFSDLVSTQYRRTIYYDWHSLFASFGGLLGLFAGFSLMSAFELIYFFIVRLITDTMRRKNLLN